MLEEFDEKVDMEFIRFVNVGGSLRKNIGFHIKHDKELIFDLLLQALWEFTMANSSATIICKTKEGKILIKRYLSKKDKKYFINGDFWKRPEETLSK